MIRTINVIGLIGSFFNILEGYFISFNYSIFSSTFNSHVTQRHAFFHREVHDCVACPFHCAVCCSIDTYITDDLQDDILSHYVIWEFTGKFKLHTFRHFNPQFPCAENEGCVRVTYASGKHSKRPRCAGMGVGSKEDFTWSVVPFLG